MKRRHLLILPLLALLAACTRDNPAGLLPEEERAPQFDRASEFLDLGGVFYAYMDLTGEAESLGKRLNGIADRFKTLAAVEMPPLPLDFVKVLEASGFAGLKAVGLSSRAIDENMFHNRSILFFPDGITGFFRFFGETSLPFDSLRFAPEGTDFLWESGYHPPVLRDTLLSIADAVAGPFGRGMISAQMSTSRPEIGNRTLNDLIDSAGSRAFLILDFVDDSAVQIGPDTTIAEPRLLVGFDGIAEFLLSLQSIIEAHPALEWTDTEGGFEIVPTNDTPFPFDFLQPVVIADQESDRTYLTSSRSFLEECLGSGKKLRDTDSFRKAAHLLPPEGVSLVYATPEFVSSITDAIAGSMAMNPMGGGEFAGFFELLLPRLPQAIANVTTVGPEGIYSAGNLHTSHRATVANFAVQPVVMVAGMSAAMAIPAFQKVRQTSQQKTVLNNLRQIASGGQQFLLENGVTEATYADIVPEYVRTIQPVAGEDYTVLVVRPSGTLRVTLANGETVEYEY